MLGAVRPLACCSLFCLVACATPAAAPPAQAPLAGTTDATAPPTRAVAAEAPSLHAPEREPAASPPAPLPAPRFSSPVVPRSETRAIVLLYHAFNRGAQPLSVSTRDFDAQLAWLAENRVEVVSTSELLDFLEGSRALPERVAVISIDDGLMSVYTKAWPILKQRKVRFTLGIPTGMLEDPKNAPVMTWDQVREMVASGLCEIASHGHMHRRLVGLEGKRRWEELELSRDLIRERVGEPPVAYFYPLGAYDPPSAEAVEKAGYRAAFRATGAPIAAGAGSHFWLPRVSIFHGESAGVLAHYFRPKFLGQVRYSARRDPGLAARAP